MSYLHLGIESQGGFLGALSRVPSMLVRRTSVMPKFVVHMF